LHRCPSQSHPGRQERGCIRILYRFPSPAHDARYPTLIEYNYQLHDNLLLHLISSSLAGAFATSNLLALPSSFVSSEYSQIPLTCECPQISNNGFCALSRRIPGMGLRLGRVNKRNNNRRSGVRRLRLERGRRRHNSRG